MDDFVTGERISSKTIACSSNNVGPVQAHKNFQTVMQIVFSDAFANCLDTFIDLLEGVKQSMDVVAAEFLRYSVELSLRKFFRIVRSVRVAALTEYSVKSPELCAILLTSLFKKLATDLTDPATLLGLETYFRVRTARKLETEARATSTSLQRNLDIRIQTYIQSSLPCRQPSQWMLPRPPRLRNRAQVIWEPKISAVRKDRRPYVCSHGKDCTYRHISVSGKSNLKLLDIMSTMHMSFERILRRQ
jgi:hypothetical protein